jgi:dihydroorotate dehydrogenase (NAD+) catalytic subunit
VSRSPTLRPPARRDAFVDLTTRVGEVVLPNPIMTAAGTSGHGAELNRFQPLADLGAVVVKSLSAEAWPGNPAPRLVPLTAGMLNSVGLQNAGVEDWVGHDLSELAAVGARVVVSVWATSPGGYRRVAQRLSDRLAGSPVASRVLAVEANISCPNVEDRRRMFAHSVTGTADAVAAVIDGMGGARLPVWAKLSPNVTDITEMAASAMAAGASGLTLVNTLMGMAIDPLTGRPRLGGGGGGLSGPALHPIAVRAVYECRSALGPIPIVGVGGVASGEDAAELMAAGASAVQVGTATFADPRAPGRVLAQLRRWCAERGVGSASDLVGRAHA